MELATGAIPITRDELDVAAPRVKEVHVAYILLIWLGLVGGHKFYLGRPWIGVLWILTLGVFGVGWIIDTFTLKRQVEQANKR